MNHLIKTLIVFCFTVLYGGTLPAQQKDTVPAGYVDGVVRDSAHNYVLVSATVAIYTNDSALVSYQLTNNAGEFLIRRLPAGLPLKIVASYIGYGTIEKKFIIPVQTGKINLRLNMGRADKDLAEVVVRAIPPVRMNGDTLEFNAAAFKLDPNAQADDLLRVLPGVTVWGDGTITVNGRTVKRVLVNGKPFFGNDARIATQNLPKNIVEKVQVYQQKKNEENTLDSVTEVNIKLKKGKDIGYFGRLSGGYGTRDRYEVDGSLNFFTPRIQIGLVASSNNVNKIANDAATLLRNSTFKGTGASIEYQPDFTITGLNRFNSCGLTFQQDFIPDPGFYKNNRLSGDYFFRSNQENMLQDFRTIINFSGDSSLVQQNTTRRKVTSESHIANAKYEKKKYQHVFSIGSNYNNTIQNTFSESRTSVDLSNKGLQSMNSLIMVGKDNLKVFDMETNVKNTNQSGFPQYEANYGLTVNDHANDQVKSSAFISVMDSAGNTHFNRIYDNRSMEVAQRLLFKLPNLNPLLSGRIEESGLQIGFQSKLYTSQQKGNNKVADKDPNSGDFMENTYLTNSSRYHTLNWLPALTLDRNIYKGLKDRYEKSWSIQLSLQTQLFYQKNSSDRIFQNFSRSYKKMVPEGKLRFTNHRFGAFNDNYNLTFSASSDYPLVSQLVPLVDSSNLYYTRKGNLELKEQDKREMSFKFEHISERRHNPFYYNISVKLGFIHNYFADSSIIDREGRRYLYTVNINGHRYLQAGSTLNKAFKWGTHQLQLTLSSSLGLYRTPNYINSVLNYSSTLSAHNRVGFYYTWHEWLAVNVAQGYQFYQARQNRLESGNFNNSLQFTELSCNVRCNRRISLGSNMTYNKNASTGSRDINYALWNANASCRLFKGNTAEIKLAALDLLHQNVGIVNYGMDNSITYGTINVLQQYFMVTLSWFPRKFGKSDMHK